MAAEYVLKEGNPNVLLCERGIRTYEPSYRFTLDLMAVPALRELTHLPIVIDPSHAAGKRSLVEPLSPRRPRRSRRCPSGDAPVPGGGRVRRSAGRSLQRLRGLPAQASGGGGRAGRQDLRAGLTRR